MKRHKLDPLGTQMKAFVSPFLDGQLFSTRSVLAKVHLLLSYFTNLYNFLPTDSKKKAKTVAWMRGEV